MNEKKFTSRKIPLETDLCSKNHDAFANAIEHCQNGDPASCIQQQKCSLEGGCFGYKPTQLSEADAMINELRKTIAGMRARENQAVALIENQVLSLEKSYKKALKAKNEKIVWGSNFAKGELTKVLNVLNPK